MPKGKAFVTGGAGFIGAHVCRALLESGFTVTVFDDLSTGHLSNLSGLDVEFVPGSILDRNELERASVGSDTVVHLAARPSVPRSLNDPLATHETNATGTVHVLEVARTLGAYVVVASSSSVYGATPDLPQREGGAVRPISPYAASKLSAESYATAYAHCFSLPVLAFRFFNVYGPLQTADHDYAAVIPRFISAALRNAPLLVFGDGLQTRDFTFVGTVARVIAEATRHRVTNLEPVNLAFGSRVSLLTLVGEIRTALGAELSVEHLPPRSGDVRDSQADSASIRGLFPNVTPVSLAVGLSQTISWHRTQASGHPRL